MTFDSSGINVNGNLNVTGDLLYTQTKQTLIKDPIVTLGKGSVASDTTDRGLEYNYGDATLGFFGYDKTLDLFTIKNSSNILDGLFKNYYITNKSYGHLNADSNNIFVNIPNASKLTMRKNNIEW